MKTIGRSAILLAVVGCWLAVTVNGSGLMISEIAWAGTAASSADEWIELVNQSDATIDLSGWVLAFGDVRISLGEAIEDTIEVRTFVLAPGAFLLLERTDDNTVSDIPADILYKGALSNDGILVELIDPEGTSVDSAVIGETGWPGGSPGGDEPAYCTMERTNAGAWTSNNAIICNGVDADGVPLNGTPGQANSADVLAQWAPAVQIGFPSSPGSILSGTEWITWTASDPNGVDSGLSIAIFVSAEEDNEWSLLIENLANMGSFAWDTTTLASASGYRLLIQATDPEGYIGQATTEPFEIANATD